MVIFYEFFVGLLYRSNLNKEIKIRKCFYFDDIGSKFNFICLVVMWIVYFLGKDVNIYWLRLNLIEIFGVVFNGFRNVRINRIFLFIVLY